MRQLISSFIFSRLDYCNALLVNLPFSTIAPLQWVQNAAARLLLGLPRHNHVRPALKELHWLPVVFRIKFKVALLIFTVHTRRCPDYLTDSLQACNRLTVIRDGLVSARRPVLTILFHGQERNSATESCLWPAQLYGTGCLPAAVREADNLYSFKRKLKAHPFTVCFNDWLSVLCILHNFVVHSWSGAE